MFRKVPSANKTHALSMDQLGSVIPNNESRELSLNELDIVSGGGYGGGGSTGKVQFQDFHFTKRCD